MQVRQENTLKRMEQDYDVRMEEQVGELREKMRLLQVDRKSNIEQLEAAKDTNKHFIKQLKEENKHLRKELAEIRNVIIGTGFGTPSTILGNTMSSSSLVGTFTPTLLPPTTTTTTTTSSNTSISSTINATTTTTTTTTPPPFVPNTDASEELKQLIILLTKARKAYDDTKHKVSSQVQLLEELKDEVKDLELESKKPSMEDTPETRKIRLLENRLDKAMIKYNEAQSIRKTYEQIVKRLKEERIGFDTQLAAMERALVAKQHDFDELLLLSTDAVHAKEMTLQELEKQRGQFEEEKKKRDKEIREKIAFVKLKIEMNQRLEQRKNHFTHFTSTQNTIQEKEQQQQNTNKIGEKEEEEEKEKEKKKTTTTITTEEIGKKKEQRTKIDIFENAFRKIKEATGVSDVNEVIQKICSQETTTENLQLLAKENTFKIENLLQECTFLKTRVEELKYTGSGGGSTLSTHKRKVVDEYEHQFTLACTKMERSKMKLDRLQKVLISVQAGVEHLVDQLNSVKVVDHASNGQIPKENRVVTDETIVEALQESELTLIGVMNQIKLPQVTSSYNNNTMIDENKNSTLPSTTTTIMDMSTNLLVSKSPSTKDFDSMTNTTRPYNQRISLPLNQNDTIALEEENEEVPDGFALDDPEEALSRDRVKKASQQVLLAHEKKKKKIAISLPGSTGKGKQKIKKEQ